MSTHETIVVFDTTGKAIYWHDKDASSGYVPDSDDLFDMMWENKDRLGGFAHTHPWNGEAIPSGIDLSTYRDLELALGKRLVWPVVSFTEVTLVFWDKYEPGDGHGEGEGYVCAEQGYFEHLTFDWVDELRRKSGAQI
jgi:hypothetical protein